MTLTSRLVAALTAPSTSALGAWSPPIASTAMVSMSARPLLLHDFDHFAALVLPAMRAYTVRELGLVAVGTFRQAGRLQRIVRAAVAGPPLGVSAFGIRHFFSTSRFLISGARPSA